MKGKRHSPEQIIKKLREADAMISARQLPHRVSPAALCRGLEVVASGAATGYVRRVWPGGRALGAGRATVSSGFRGRHGNPARRSCHGRHMRAARKKPPRGSAAAGWLLASFLEMPVGEPVRPALCGRRSVCAVVRPTAPRRTVS
jgi:hypothetical protein